MNEKLNITISNSEFLIFCLPLKVKLISASKAFSTVGYMHTWITSTILMINTIMKIIIVDVFVNILFLFLLNQKIGDCISLNNLDKTDV